MLKSGKVFWILILIVRYFGVEYSWASFDSVQHEAYVAFDVGRAALAQLASLRNTRRAQSR